MVKAFFFENPVYARDTTLQKFSLKIPIYELASLKPEQKSLLEDDAFLDLKIPPQILKNPCPLAFLDVNHWDGGGGGRVEVSLPIKYAKTERCIPHEDPKP